MYRCLLLLLFGFQVVHAQVKPDPEWVDQKFSMFIHWGLYSELGGVWKDQPVLTGYSEQIQSFASIPSDEYEAVAVRFNPEKWDAEAVVRLARLAGMKSVVFTSKHHDGFCMYHSNYTDYNVVDATPFKRDVMKELSEACRKYGIKFGVYFSLIDWHFPGTKISSHNADPISPEHHAFNMKQVEEILTNYGPVSELWFDMGSLTPEQSKELYDLVNRLQPECMVSGRLGNNQGDFCVMGDNQYPDYKIGIPWQTPASFFPETWGYRSWQERGDLEQKINEKLLGLVKVVSRGGNYLLNIGPRGDGSIVEYERDALLKMGRWLNRYGRAIYNTRANPFEHAGEWGDMTMKGNRLYLFIERMPDDRLIRLSGIQGEAVRAVLVGREDPLRLDQHGNDITLYIPETVYPDRHMIVAEIAFAEPFQVLPVRMVPAERLIASNAVPAYGYSSMDYYSSFRCIVGRSWGFLFDKPYAEPVVVYTDNDRYKTIKLTIDNIEQELLLQGGEVKHLQVQPGSVRWESVYQTKISDDRFGSFCLGENHRVDPAREENGVIWKKIPRFGFGTHYVVAMTPKQSLYLLCSIESDTAQSILVELSNPEGLQVVLNGKTLRKQISVGDKFKEREIVMLPLDKGDNQLIVRYYNRSGETMEYGVNPDVPQIVYQLRLKPLPLLPREVHSCELRLLKPENRNCDMGLQDVWISMD